MRPIATAALIASALTGGLLIGRIISTGDDSKEPVFNGNTDIATKLKILQAGYIEIPETACNANPSSGIIRIVVSDLLTDLKTYDTVPRNISYFKPGDLRVNDLNVRGAELEKAPQESEVNGFPTNLDFHTVLRDGTLLVKPDTNVTIRVVLQKTPGVNDSLDFLRRDAPEGAISDFAVMRSWGSPKKMFCRRQLIMTLPNSAGEYVEFDIQSVATSSKPAPSAGGFGIGLMVRDSKTKTVTPIILDPNDRNKG